MLISKYHQPVTVRDFYEKGRDLLGLELLAGEQSLSVRIQEIAINRPGLALAGFFNYFAFRRIQVMGLAEYSYLLSLSPDERVMRLESFFGGKIPCVVIARNKRAFPEILKLAQAHAVPVFRTRMVTKDFVNAATILLENLTAPRVKAQGTMIEFMGIGVLIEGKPGMGKSETALGLIRKGAALVSDDVTVLRVDSAGSLIGSPVNVTRYHMEIRGIGIIHVPSLFGVASVREEKKLDLVATLCEPGPRADEDRSNTLGRTKELLGVRVPQVLIPVAPGRDLANVIETAALDQRLRRLGHDAAKELDEKLMALMTGTSAGSE
ncbi:MAG: HPr(Ser) kinase/phosphatase [Lentisphaerae bacterium RIFOXYC12_FULL_60_16]|nr:MAG: HPr(Ser) kinase/phosphatase [Lentisphaerae bacterium RIFOXYC12_FULL_60_16]OGV84375.1 MAG: HPr(Ser) kinase/phosphatase [Lentisphaerae bacterium RIFOXYB12_FULL_60_10]